MIFTTSKRLLAGYRVHQDVAVVIHAVLHREYAVLVLARRVDELYDVVLRLYTLDLGEGCEWELPIITHCYCYRSMESARLLRNPHGMGCDTYCSQWWGHRSPRTGPPRTVCIATICLRAKRNYYGQLIIVLAVVEILRNYQCQQQQCQCFWRNFLGKLTH